MMIIPPSAQTLPNTTARTLSRIKVPHQVALLGFISRDESHLISELLVICSAYADIMRKVDRISAISDTMNIILGQQHRYSSFRLYRGFLKVETIRSSFPHCLKVNLCKGRVVNEMNPRSWTNFGVSLHKRHALN